MGTVEEATVAEAFYETSQPIPFCFLLCDSHHYAWGIESGG